MTHGGTVRVDRIAEARHLGSAIEDGHETRTICRARLNRNSARSVVRISGVILQGAVGRVFYDDAQGLSGTEIPE